MRNKTDHERRIARRNLIAGVLFGIIVATGLGAYAKTAFKKMVKGAPATAADVNQAHQNLADAIDTLQAKIAKLESDPDCPPGYTRDTTAPASITVCKRGVDELVKVSSFWVDRYEMSIVDSGAYAGGKCNGTGKQYGSSSCNISTSAKEATGARSKCVSRWGAQDMVGNVWEWVAWWSEAGRGWMTKDGESTSPWPAGKGYGDGKDGTWNIDGTAYNGSAWTKGMPAAALRGGDWGPGSGAGVFAMYMSKGPSGWNSGYSARCCRQ